MPSKRVLLLDVQYGTLEKNMANTSANECLIDFVHFILLHFQILEALRLQN